MLPLAKQLLLCFTCLVATAGAKPFLSGYVCPSCPSDPSPRGLLSEIHPAYNVVHFAFLGFDGAGKVIDELDSPYISSSKVFKLAPSDVSALQAQGRKVTVSVGGGAGGILDCASNSSFVNTLGSGLLAAVQKWGFDGVDFDIEHRSGDYVQCAVIISDVISMLKSKKPGILISLAPQMTNLYPDYLSVSAGFNELAPLVSKSLASIDFIQPQMYNTWAAVETIAYAETYAKELVKGFTVKGGASSFHVQVPLSKIVLGYPSSPHGAGSGYISPSQVATLVSTLKIKGIMAWSIGWDELNNWAFASAFSAALNQSSTAAEK